ncbi:hypothetical protein D3C76_608440 [compost metagenome]
MRHWRRQGGQRTEVAAVEVENHVLEAAGGVGRFPAPRHAQAPGCFCPGRGLCDERSTAGHMRAVNPLLQRAFKLHVLASQALEHRAEGLIAGFLEQALPQNRTGFWLGRGEQPVEQFIFGHPALAAPAQRVADLATGQPSGQTKKRTHRLHAQEPRRCGAVAGKPVEQGIDKLAGFMDL